MICGAVAKNVEPLRFSSNSFSCWTSCDCHTKLTCAFSLGHGVSIELRIHATSILRKVTWHDMVLSMSPERELRLQHRERDACPLTANLRTASQDLRRPLHHCVPDDLRCSSTGPSSVAKAAHGHIPSSRPGSTRSTTPPGRFNSGLTGRDFRNCADCRIDELVEVTERVGQFPQAFLILEQLSNDI